MKADEFEMRETLAPEDLDRHPLWAPYRAADRETLLAWGVAPERLDAELERYAYCGPEPLCPLPVEEALPARSDWIVAATVETADGSRFPGYLLGSDVVGLYAAGREWVFNRGLPRRISATAEALAQALGREVRAVLPLRRITSALGGGAIPSPL